MQIVDSHCHLDRLDLSQHQGEGLGRVISEAGEAGVNFMLCVGIDLSNAQTVVDIAQAYDNIFASVGVHPCDVSDDIVPADTLHKLSQQQKVVAIGETGLDYHYSKESKELQQDSFAMHLDVARQRQLPTIVHTREAKLDTINIIKEYACPKYAGVLHCFTEDWAMARQALDLGFYISFSGIVTFKNAVELKQVAKKVPLDRMLVETDSPYLAPVPYRGKPNFPKHTRQVVEYIAELRGLPIEEVAECTTNNFFNLFNSAELS